MDPMTRAKSLLEEQDIIQSERVLDLFPTRFQLFGNVSHDVRVTLAQRLNLIPSLQA